VYSFRGTLAVKKVASQKELTPQIQSRHPLANHKKSGVRRDGRRFFGVVVS
jgi:hypothetical protein